MYANFTEELASATTGELKLLGATFDMRTFQETFADNVLVHYVAIDEACVKASGSGTYSLATNAITRNDDWNSIDGATTTNIALTGEAVVSSTPTAEGLHTIGYDTLIAAVNNVKQTTVLQTTMIGMIAKGYM